MAYLPEEVQRAAFPAKWVFMHRREFLNLSVASALGVAMPPAIYCLEDSRPIIDSHIHLFDPRRPGGVPWPEKNDATLYKPALPPRYEALAKGHGIVGAIAVECSPWLIDNLWLQEIVDSNPFIVGFIGDLSPETPDFKATLDRLHASDLFLGIRYGNLWNRDLGAAVRNSDFIAGLKDIAAAGLVLETANPDAELIESVCVITEKVPGLRVVIDHLPNSKIPENVTERRNYESNLHRLAQTQTVFVKGSEIARKVNEEVRLDAAFYKASLDAIWDLFGEDRILFGSDWPNSDSVAPFGKILGVAEEYIKNKSQTAKEKYYAKNSLAAYRWKPRTEAQRKLLRS